MLETYNYWLSLIHSEDWDTLEEEIKEEVFRLTPETGREEHPVDIEEALCIAEGYKHE